MTKEEAASQHVRQSTQPLFRISEYNRIYRKVGLDREIMASQAAPKKREKKGKGEKGVPARKTKNIYTGMFGPLRSGESSAKSKVAKPGSQEQSAKDKERAQKIALEEGRLLLKYKIPRLSRQKHGSLKQSYSIIAKWLQKNTPPNSSPHQMAKKKKSWPWWHGTGSILSDSSPISQPKISTNIAHEVYVFGRILQERFERELPPRLSLQYTLLKLISKAAREVTTTLNSIDWLLFNDDIRDSPNGAIMESHTQELDAWMLEVGELLEKIVPLIGPFFDVMSDQEVERKLRVLWARYCASQVYFDPQTYTGTIDPVFWPRPQGEPLGI
jgi:hypothetical protein